MKFALLCLLLIGCLAIDGAPKISNFDFYAPQRLPQKVQSQYLVAETSQKVDMKCRDGELESSWVMKTTKEKITSPFVVQPTSAGDYECPVKRVHLVVTEPMQFLVTSNVDVEDIVKFNCGMTVHTDRENLNLTLEIRNYQERPIGWLSLSTTGEAAKIELDADTQKRHKEMIFASQLYNTFSCVLNIADHRGKHIFDTRKSMAVRLYSPLKNVHPNATKAAPGQAIQCHSESMPPAHRYEWKFYESRRENKLQKPFYISSNHILRIFDEGEHSFICTAFNLMGKKEYSLSWVGSLHIQGERKVEARSIGKWVAGGSFATIVVLVAVVSYARS